LWQVRDPGRACEPVAQVVVPPARAGTVGAMDVDAEMCEEPRGGETEAPQGVTDAMRLFQVSRQLDRLRDDCRWLLRRAPGEALEALEAAQRRMELLWSALEGLLDDRRLDELRADVGAAGADSMASMVLLTGQVAAWVDGVLLAPAFVANEQVRAYNTILLEQAQRARSMPERDERTPGETASSAYL